MFVLLWITEFQLILQKGIDENWEAALEHNPEGFARVVYMILYLLYFNANRFVVFHNKIQAVIFQVMLYVDMEVNGVPMKVSGRSKYHSSWSSGFDAANCSFSGPL
jgi:DNA damage-inducible protein 1